MVHRQTRMIFHAFEDSLENDRIYVDVSPWNSTFNTALNDLRIII